MAISIKKDSSKHGHLNKLYTGKETKVKFDKSGLDTTNEQEVVALKAIEPELKLNKKDLILDAVLVSLICIGGLMGYLVTKI